MPQAIDEKAMESPDLTSLDISRPPLKQIPYAEFPKVLYLHPKDKAKEHRTMLVSSKEEQEHAMARGWKTVPHIPVMPDPIAASGEYEYEAEEQRRGPGRPRKDESAA